MAAINTGPTIAQADAFVDSVGVNTHFSYTDSIYYQQFPLIKQALVDLKVRHIRAGLHTTTYAMHNQLGDSGIRGLFVVDPTIDPAVVLGYPERVNNMEALENANEPDAKGGTAWVAPLKASMAALYAHGQAIHKPVIAAALVNPQWWADATNSHKLLGDISAQVDYGALHNYMGAYHPESKGWGGGAIAGGWCYGSIPWSIDQLSKSAPGKPIWTTETGYTINPAKPGTSLPETVFATYLPRLLFSQWNAGIQRTYIYELADDPSTPCCMGLMDKTGARRKPFYALENLLKLLADPGKPFTPAPLAFTITGAPATLQQTLLQKRDHSYWLALWLGVPSYDPHKYVLINNPAAPITVAWPGKTAGYRIYKLDGDGGLTDQGHGTGNSAVLPVDDNVLILKIALS